MKFLTTLAAALALAGAASAQQPPQCGPVADVEAWLSITFGEAPLFSGLESREGVMVRLFLNPSSGTWTVLTVGADGMACIAMYGGTGTIHAAPASGDPA